VVTTDECTGVSQLLGAHARAAPPKSTPRMLGCIITGELDWELYLTFPQTYRNSLYVACQFSSRCLYLEASDVK